MRSLILLLAALAAPCHAADWTRADTTREAAFLSFGALDWLQTRSALKHPDLYKETNRFIGAHPSRADVNVWFGFGLAAHVGIAVALPPKYRAPFQYVTIGLEAGQVARNFRIGVRIEI